MCSEAVACIPVSYTPDIGAEYKGCVRCQVEGGMRRSIGQVERNLAVSDGSICDRFRNGGV